MFLLGVLLSFQLIDLNQASVKQLMTVEGIGQKMAERMLEHRHEKGGFSRLEDLMLIPGMKAKLFEKIKTQITVGRFSKARQAIQKNDSMADSELHELFKEHSAEPSIQKVQEEALRYANAHPQQLRNWISRARKAHWLPRLETGFSPHFGRWVSSRDRPGDLDELSARQGHEWRFQVRFEWHLNHLVFNREELSVGHEFSRQSLMRERILRKVNETYFDRRRLQLQIKLNGFSDASSKMEAQIKTEELTAELDGFTGGWFSQQLDR
ncbi:MAG: helix-hairpin-helix domain-containing protein [Myxococcaceae bacterium]|nr:helix-hairpin-helix domain-containing protein [Myxococcaceae bacterium]MBH2006245.1 helix-hairpin-helix domain-containing protein [Myxococcaceae bacterium]